MSSSSKPSQRHTSVSSLVYSTLGPGLSLLPQEDKNDGDWTVIETTGATVGMTTKHTEIDAEEGRGLKSGPGETSRPSRSSTASVGDIHCEVVGTRQNDAEDTASILSRLYSDATQNKKKQKKRLGFNSKSGAGSVSSSEHAILSKQDSSEDVFYPVVSQQLKEQMSKSSIHEETEREASSSDGSEPVGYHKSISTGGLGFIPRAPTGSEWGSSAGSSREMVGLQEILKDLDREAGERKHRERVSSLQNDSMIGRKISWDEEAISNRHLWQLVDSREACHLAESQYCQQLKVFHPKRQKVRCSACRVLVHDTCIKQLYYQGYCCRESFREIKQKVKETVTYHHFLHRRRATGKCRKCDRSFENWKLINGRDIVGISCSWCGDGYHVSCFNEGLKKELCHLGPLRNLIIPPSWIVKIPALEQMSSGASYSGSNEAHISPKGSARRKTRRSRRKKTEEKASRYFTVKPIAQRHHKPLLVFINPKSGGNQGAKLMQTFQWLLNPRQVFDLSQGGPEFGLKLFQGLSNFRVLACGGDGTAGWIFSIIDKLDIRPPPPLAILPLGTGNDLARVFNWGSGYADEPIDKILLHVEDGPVEEMDRWMLNVWENPKATGESDGADDTPLHVINNYFSIGCDAQISLEFHLEREANPEKYNKRYKNKLQYGMLGGKDIFLRRFQTLTDHIQLYCDGEDLTEKIQNLRLESICFLNISSYGAGADAWGTPSSRDPVFKPQVMSDGKIEVLGFWASTLPKLKVGLAHGERIAQCEHIKLVMDRSFPVQIDGEACKLKPSVIEVGLKNKALLVRKVPRSRPEAPLQGVRDSIKLSVSKVTTEQYDNLNSEPNELRKAAKPVGLVIATAQDNLGTVRKQIEQISQETDEDGEPRMGRDWRFLDMANSGRVDRMFQVTPDQENNLFIGDMLSDGLLIVEFPPSSVASTPITQTSLLMAASMPVVEDGSSDSRGSSDSAAARRKSYGRNASYEQATRFSPGPVGGSDSKNELTVTTTSSLSASGADSSPSDTPALSDDDLVSPLAPFMKDTGSDSAGGSEDVMSSVQKGLVDAVKRGNVEKVRHYHKKGAKLTLPDNAGLTPLHYAARLNKIGVVEYIVKNIPKEALDIVDEEKNQTPLHKAAWYGYVEICKILVESGASLNRLDYQNNNVLDKAVQSGIKELQDYFESKMKASKAVTSENELAI